MTHKTDIAAYETAPKQFYNRDGAKRGHCIALFSGGLDSALAVLLMLQQNIEVTALTFMTHFGCDLGDRSSCGSNPYPVAEKYGFNVKLMHLGQKFVDIVENPKFGHGAHMNPCVDCRILMLTEAKNFMAMVNADFIITGEVMGQRPFSQVKDKLFLVLKETGLTGKVLRPLSAKLLPPTDAETSGMIDRDKLEGIRGRGRHRQIELAKQFGLENYPNPASGCLLTDEGYSNRLRDLIAHTDRVTFDDLNLLRAGRHFRLDKQTKVIVGRNEDDNNKILAYKLPNHHVLEAVDVSSPTALLIGPATDENIRKAAMITARYTTARNQPSVKVEAKVGEKSIVVDVKPVSDDDLGPVIIR
jgi:tRNA U34 2-thiouridine synthase MnmA/TrmU